MQSQIQLSFFLSNLDAVNTDCMGPEIFLYHENTLFTLVTAVGDTVLWLFMKQYVSLIRVSFSTTAQCEASSLTLYGYYEKATFTQFV